MLGTRVITRLRACCTAAGLQRYSTAYLEPDASEVQQELLETAVKHAKQHGWTRACLLQAAKDLQLSPAAASMFPRGASELVEHVIRHNNAALAAELQEHQQQFTAMPLPQRIAAAVKRRLEMNAPYMNSWPQALAVLAQPRNSPEAVKLLLQLLDEIWYAAGDTSTDVSWYTKRATLAAIYTSTELYMLTDYSPGFADTWQQLERRIHDALWLDGTAASVASLPQQLLAAVLQAAGNSSGTSSSTGAATAAATAAAEPTAASSAANNSGSGSGRHASAVAAESGESASSSFVTYAMDSNDNDTSSHRNQSEKA